MKKKIEYKILKPKDHINGWSLDEPGADGWILAHVYSEGLLDETWIFYREVQTDASTIDDDTTAVLNQRRMEQKTIA